STGHISPHSACHCQVKPIHPSAKAAAGTVRKSGKRRCLTSKITSAAAHPTAPPIPTTGAASARKLCINTLPQACSALKNQRPGAGTPRHRDPLAFNLVQLIDVFIAHVDLQSLKHSFARCFMAGELLKLAQRLISQHAMPANRWVAIGSRVHRERSWPRVIDDVQDRRMRQRLFVAVECW